MLCKKYTDFLDLVLYQVYPRSFMDSNAAVAGNHYRKYEVRIYKQ